MPARPPAWVMARRIGVALAIAVLIVAVDQASKILVVERMDLRTLGAIDVLPPWLNFRMAWNTGVNFGLLSGGNGRWLLVAFAGALAAVLLGAAGWQARALRIAGLGVAAGGAIGNLIDRVIYGAVADFLNMSVPGVQNPWSFNVADIAVFAGLALVVWPLREMRAARAAAT